MKKKLVYCLGLILSTILVMVGVGSFSLANPAQSEVYQENKILRLHVVANSDGEEDQALKRQVRDQVVAKTYHLFQEAKTAQEAKVIAQENLDTIRQVALKEVRKAGKPYDVKVEIGRFTFPAKTYGSLNLAAGEYDALRVIIGQGAGKNWWCVLFPPLCFIDAENGLAIDRLADNQEMGSSPIKIKFKLLEVMKKDKKEEHYLAKANSSKANN